ncbi:MAG: RHS repeat-associated core domain-containing protein [Candidatus Zixiibacteriota bacterium]
MNFNGRMYDLVQLSVDTFVTSNGMPWKIFRQINDSITDVPIITGWTIISDDGTYFRFGDFNDTSLTDFNATWNTFRYGNHIGCGMTDDEESYPYSWNLRMVHDQDTLHWISYHYLNETGTLRVYCDADTLVNSSNYMRYSYIDEIEFSDGRSIVLDYSDRTDYYANPNVHAFDYYSTKKLDKVKIKNEDGTTQSAMLFDYDYLTAHSDSIFHKLMLRDILRVNGDEDDTLSITRFSYYTNLYDIAYGSIKEIYYPSGSIREYHYSNIGGAENITDLDTCLHDPMEVPSNYDLKTNDRVFYSVQGDSAKIGIWDGYWNIDSINVTSSDLLKQTPAISSEGWIAYYQRSIDSVVVKVWQGGFWQTYKQAAPSGIDASNTVELYPGDDCFLFITKGSASYNNGDSTFTKETAEKISCYHYNTREDQWKLQELFTPNANMPFIQNVQISNNTFTVAVHENSYYDFVDGKVFYGSYNYAADSMCYDSLYITDWWEKASNLEDTCLIATGNSFFAYINRWNGLAIYDWTGDTWESYLVDNYDEYGISNSISLYNNNIIWGKGSNNNYTYFRIASFSQDSIYVQTNVIDSLYLYPTQVQLNSHTMAVLCDYFLDGTDYNIKRFEATDIGWEFFDDWGFYQVDTGGGHYAKMDELYFALSDDNYSIVYREIDSISNYKVMYSEYFADNSWTPVDTVVYSHSQTAPSIADNYILYLDTNATNIRVYYRDRFNESTGYKDMILLPDSSYFGAGNSLIAKNNAAYLYYYNSSTGDMTQKAFAKVDNSFKGKIPLIVVDTVFYYQYAEEDNPVIKTYSYFKGHSDALGRTPEFSKVIASQPHYKGDSATGYFAAYYFNDISGDRFADGHYADSVFLPDFNDTTGTGESIYGYTNGGYLLDGNPYLSYGFSADSGTSENVDYEKLAFRFEKTSDSSIVENVYRNVLGSLERRNSGYETSTNYLYNKINGHRAQERTGLYGGDSIISTYSFAFEDTVYANRADSIFNDYAIGLYQGSETVFYDSSEASTTIIDKQRREFHKTNTWSIYESYTWEDLYDLVDTIYTQRVCSVDDNGNVTGYVNMNGDTLRLKYEPGTNRVIASGTRMTMNELAVNGFEFGGSWDGWGLYNSVIDTNATIALTGNCYNRIAAVSTDTYGATKTISQSSISDSLYYLSAWMRTNGQGKIYIYAYYSGGVGLDSVVANAQTIGQLTDWTRYELVVNINELANWNEITSLQIWAMAEGGITNPNVVCVDDIQFHPLGSHVNTALYNDNGYLIAKNNANNYPAIYTYDDYDRVVGIQDYKGDVVEDYEYNRAEVWDIDTPGELIMSSGSCGTIDTTFVVNIDQSAYYSLYALCDEGATAFISVNGSKVDSILCDGYSDSVRVSGSITLDKGDTITLQIDKSCLLGGADSLNARVTFVSYVYNPDQPENTIIHTYNDNDSTITLAKYYDSHGFLIQQRMSNYILEADTLREATLVMLGDELDGMERTTKRFKPYYDMIGACGVFDYTPQDSTLIELNAYYNGSYAADCDERPYAEFEYYDDISRRIKQVSQPGDSTVWGLNSTHTLQYQYTIDSLARANVVHVTDPDGNSVIRTVDFSGYYAIDSTTYTVQDSLGQDSTAYIIKTSHYNEKRQLTSITLEDGVDSVTLREYEYDDLGRIINEWRNDFGTIRRIYDLKGQLRFLQTDRDSANNRFVYYKYDAYGRRIEEGLCSATIDTINVFTKEFARDQNFPDDSLIGSGKTMKYEYEFDYLEKDSLYVTYGALLRTNNEDTTYYREFYYNPLENKDSVVVELPMVSGDKKSIVHKYDDISGRVEELQVFPFETTDGARVYNYMYNRLGRLESVREGHLTGTYDYTRDYITYQYLADGRISQSSVGAYDSTGIVPFASQAMEYSYNPRGLLTSINDTTSVAATMGGFKADSIHFGMNLTYDSDAAGANSYYNGLVSRITSAHSSDTGVISYAYEYTYNELGWLTKADFNADGSFTAGWDRQYEYNFMGNRSSISMGTGKLDYIYESSTSAKLINGNSGLFQNRTYDEVGNTTSDAFSGIGSQYYEYRNLLSKAVIQPSVLGADSSTVEFWYDELLQRIRKRHEYTYQVGCDSATDTVGGGGGLDLLGGDGGGILGTTLGGPGIGIMICYNWGIDEEFYLYDGKVLLAVFDKNDNVTHAYVNGPTGKVAVYKDNADSLRYYFLKDQIGNTRVVVDDTGTVVQYLDYHPFGHISKAWSSFNEKFKFTGKERDALGAFDYDYFGARYYEPGTGRFTTIDNYGQFADGYNYCGNNPISSIDPDGNRRILIYIGYYFTDFWVDGNQSGATCVHVYGYYDTDYGANGIIDDIVGSNMPGDYLGNGSGGGGGKGGSGGKHSGSGGNTGAGGGSNSGGSSNEGDGNNQGDGGEQDNDPKKPPENQFNTDKNEKDIEKLVEEAMDQEPMTSDDPACQDYGDEEYLAWYLQEFCECAGDSDWANSVRACLHYLNENGVNMTTAHRECYIAASSRYDVPLTTLVYCSGTCLTETGENAVKAGVYMMLFLGIP